MNKMFGKKQYIFTGIFILSFVFMSLLLIVSIRQIQGQARVVNYVGIVRGATQKLVKEELHNVSDDALIERLNSIQNGLMYGKEHNLVVLQDEHYLDLLGQVQMQWNEIKEQIYQVRLGGDPEKLFDASQDYFELVNETVFAAEEYSEARIEYIMKLLIGFDAGLIILFIMSTFFVIRGVAAARRANMLDQIAYIDPMTHLDNRASCERLIDRVSSAHSENDMAVVMFDMNNLKIVNDSLGHQSGDKAIIQFSRILEETTKSYGFIGRYGGDEFIAVLENADLRVVQEYLERLRAVVQDYNELKENDLEKLSFASGYCTGNLKETNMDDMLYEADKNMYENKHRMKKGLLQEG